MRLRGEWRPLAGTRACSLNVQPNGRRVKSGSSRQRAGLVGGLRTRRRYAPTPLPAVIGVFGRFAGAVGPMNTGKWSGDGDAGGSPTPSTPSPGTASSEAVPNA